jgi:hypothetical protein
MENKNKLSKKLAELTEKFAKSGLRLTDESSKVKAIAFIGGVRKRDNPESGRSEGSVRTGADQQG